MVKRLEGPGSEERLAALQRRFRSVSERLDEAGLVRWPVVLALSALVFCSVLGLGLVLTH
jgi:hypothetical protein